MARPESLRMGRELGAQADRLPHRRPVRRRVLRRTHELGRQGLPDPPPGNWDWNDEVDDLSNWENFEGKIGYFEKLLDLKGYHFGWRLVGHDPYAIPYDGPSAYYDGCPGTDLLDLGPLGNIHGFTNGDLGLGPDVLVFDRSWSLDFRTGSTQTGHSHDNDLVIAGCQVAPEGDYTFEKASIHTGPGKDWIFARNMNAAAIDAGNGMGGLTDTLDPDDGDDLVMLAGNVRDARVFGGYGDDVLVWYMDDGQVESIAYFGPNFFGGGGAGEAVWGDPGTDRLVLAIPPETVLVDKTPTPPGGLLLRIWDDHGDEIWWDEPVYADLYARYCVTCGTGPEGQKTLNLEYLAKDESFFTGWFWVTAFEELQLGTGPDAVVYALDQVEGTAQLIPDAVPFTPPEWPWWWCE